ncbi:serine/threonine-protein kinase [Brevibacillus laterosporus]
MAQQLSHNNVINYAFVHDGTVHEFLPPYIIMELANDGTLQDVIRKNNHVNNFLQMEEILYYFYQLINGMEHINNILVHRDIKPDNILIDNGILKISDFGLSKISNARTRTLTFKGVGALKYLAPEGWKFDKNTIQMDIYSMGIVFYELATNRHPLEVDGEGEQAWQIAHFYSSPTPPHIINTNISPIASQVIMKMIEKNTKNRFSNWKEIRNALEVDDALLNKENKVIDNLVKVQLEKDKIQHQADLQHQRNLKVKHETIKLNNFQFQDQIYNPLKDFIGDFNSRYISGEIKISKLEERDLHNEKLNLKIMLLSGKYISIQFNSLFDEQFIRETYDRFSRATRKAVARPHLDNKRVSAWGR